ncbi:MAG: PAS domain S-box protein [Hyphomicrobiaceae bacterium]
MNQPNRLWNRDFDIRTRVISLISVLLIPLLALSGWLAYSYADAERRVIETKRYDAVNNVTFLFDREIGRLQGVLNGVALSPALIGGDFENFRSHAQTIVAAINGPLTVFDTAGRELFSTRQPNDPPPQRAVPVAPIVGQANYPVGVSGVTPRDTTDTPTVTIAVPVLRDNKTIYILQNTIEPSRLSGLFADADLQPTWTSAVVDGQGRFIARSKNSDASIGALARPELGIAARGPASAGEFNNVTLEGIQSSNSFRRSKLTGWTSVVAVPAVEINAPLRRTQFLVLFGGLAISLTSLAVAWRMATRISEPVRKLSEASVALVEGRPLPEFPHQITELTEVRVAFEHAGAKLAHLAAIVASSGDAILSVGLDGNVMSWNPGAERLFGYKADEIIGQPKALIIPDDLLKQAMDQLKLARSGERVRTETQRLRKDGTSIEVSLDLAPIGDKNGSIIGMSTIAHDITEKKAADKHQHFLMRELTHRSKNLLAVIDAMARQTVRSADSLADFEKRFSSRIQGLAASHDLLVSQNWAAASLRELISKHIQIFSGDIHSRLESSGPDVYVGVEAAQTIGLALHELATNSVKYGALSRPGGKIHVHWSFENMSGDRKGLCVVWQERGGPPVTKPARTGFGHIVIERMVAQSLSGDVTLNYAPGGLIWTLRFPTSLLVDLSTTSPPHRTPALTT